MTLPLQTLGLTTSPVLYLQISNLAESYADTAAHQMRIIDWADTISRKDKSPYKRLEKARISFLKYLPCLEREKDNSANQQLWSKIFEEATLYFGSVWWVKGRFNGRDDGVPNSDDIQNGCQQLYDILVGLLPEVVVEPEASASVPADSTPTVVVNASDSGMMEASASVAVDLYPNCTCDRRAASSSDRVVSSSPRCMHCVRGSFNSRGLHRVLHMTDRATTLFSEDFPPDYSVANGKNFHAIAAALLKKLMSDPGPRSTSAKRHKSLGQRIKEGDFPCFVPTRLPHDGDMYRLFFELLLAALPLDTIRLVPHQDGASHLPNSTKPEVFHRRSWGRFQKELGVDPSLHNLRQFTIEYFTKRCPNNQDNHFKWKGFKITDEHLDACVTYATYEYGEACLDRSAARRRIL